MNCTFKEVEQIALLYDITHPYSRNDPAHFEFDHVKDYDPNKYAPEANKRRLERAVKRAKEPKKTRIKRRLAKLKKSPTTIT